MLELRDYIVLTTSNSGNKIAIRIVKIISIAEVSTAVQHQFELQGEGKPKTSIFVEGPEEYYGVLESFDKVLEMLKR